MFTFKRHTAIVRGGANGFGRHPRTRPRALTGLVGGDVSLQLEVQVLISDDGYEALGSYPYNSSTWRALTF